MLPNSIKRKAHELFKDALEEKRKRIYFNKYHSGRDLNSVSLVEEFKEELEEESIRKETVDIQDAKLLKINSEPVLFYAHRDEAWIVVYSSRIDNESTRRRVGDLSNIKGWLIDAWIPGNTLDGIYEDYSPDGENISLKRSWDPYYLYKRESKVPDEYQKYFSENPREFSQQNVEVEITTPKWRLEETMDHAMTDFLEDKSETEKSEFTMEAPPDTGIRSDGGTATKVRSSVQVKENGKVTHQSGEIGSTFKLVDETAKRSQWVYDKFEEVAGSYEYEPNQDGSYSLASYRPPQLLLFKIPEAFTRGISIKLSNFLTVGQKDVDLYGVVGSRNGKEFITETYIPFNKDEYDVTVTGIENEEATAVYIRPSEGSTSGLVYFYHKLQQKFDPNVDVEVVDEVPNISMED